LTCRNKIRSRGFALVELAISLIIFSLLGGIFISMAFSAMGGQRATTTRAKLSALDAALVSFVADSCGVRLHCPVLVGVRCETGAILGRDDYGTATICV
jgi:type II secretory pathway pseudopilin PulG